MSTLLLRERYLVLASYQIHGTWFVAASFHPRTLSRRLRRSPILARLLLLRSCLDALTKVEDRLTASNSGGLIWRSVMCVEAGRLEGWLRGAETARRLGGWKDENPCGGAGVFHQTCDPEPRRTELISATALVASTLRLLH